MKFELLGYITYNVGSCHDFRKVHTKDEFEMVTIDEAIENAKKIVQHYHERYKHFTDYEFRAELLIITPVWKMCFVDELQAHETIPEKITPAIPARPFIPAHFKEEKLA